MAEKEQSTSGADQVILAARYSSAKFWFSIIVVCVFPLLLFLGGAYIGFAEKKYSGAFGLLFLASAMLLVLLEAIFFKELLFYEDRVVKVWHLFGQKTILYSNATVKGPDWYMRWLSSAHFIFESRDNGKGVPMRLPLLYHTFFFTSETAKKIEMIVDYLAEDKESNPRKFKKFVLPKEVTCPCKH